MKTKNVIMLMVLAMCMIACSQPYNEENAKILIVTKVPNCINIVNVLNHDGETYYVAVDSAYTQHIFKVTYGGEVSTWKPKK